MKSFALLLSLLFAGHGFGETIEIEIGDPDPTTEILNGTWNAEIREVVPLNRVYISNPRLELDGDLLGQKIFALGLNGEGRKFACEQFGYGDVIDVFEDHTGKMEGKYYINVEEKDKVRVFDLGKVDAESTGYYLTVMCLKANPK